MSGAERHALGAHYTPEPAILQHVIGPSLVAPWQARVRAAATVGELRLLCGVLGEVRVLDPACGIGNFLQVAHRALVDLEAEIREVARARFGATLPVEGTIRAGQLFGIDIDPRAVEIAKALLPGANLRCDDALFCDWPRADVIVGNPPFQSKNKMPRELGAGYVDRLRRRYPGVPGRADYCVYWFRRAHDELAEGARAGLVGTNTIRQNDSREGGLGHIVRHGGTITHAVSTMVWPGEAVVHVSVVNWIKGEASGPKRLSWQEGHARQGPFRETAVAHIPASLSATVDVTGARRLAANVAARACHQGLTHGHEGFLLSPEEARAMCAAEGRNREVVFPYLTGEDLLGRGAPARWVIDFQRRSLSEAQRYALPYERALARVLPDRERAAARERERNGEAKEANWHHAGFLKKWWQLGYGRSRLVGKIGNLPRYIACSRIMKRPIFEVVPSEIRPNDALTVFTLADDYSFGILQSGLHAAWFEARCSTMKGDGRYTSSTVFDSFPWPEAPSEAAVEAVSAAAVALRDVRRREAASLRALYASTGGPLADAHEALDAAVRAAYGVPLREDPLGFLLALNLRYAAREAEGRAVAGPGLPRAAAEGA